MRFDCVLGTSVLQSLRFECFWGPSVLQPLRVECFLGTQVRFADPVLREDGPRKGYEPQVLPRGRRRYRV